MELLIPGTQLLAKSLQCQINILHRLDRHAIIKVALYSASNHDKRRTLMRHLLEEGFDPGTCFRGIQPIKPMTKD